MTVVRIAISMNRKDSKDGNTMCIRMIVAKRLMKLTEAHRPTVQGYGHIITR